MFALAPWAHRLRDAALLQNSTHGAREVEDTWPLVPRPEAAMELLKVVFEDAVTANDRRGICRAMEYLLRNAACNGAPTAEPTTVRHLLVWSRTPLDVRAVKGRVAWLHNDALLMEGTLRVLGGDAAPHSGPHRRLYALVVRGAEDDWVDVATPSAVELIIYDVTHVRDGVTTTLAAQNALTTSLADPRANEAA